MLTVTSIFAAIFALFFVALSVNVIKTRIREQSAIGDNNSDALKRAIRVHANFAEYVPFFLILLALNEMAGLSVWLLSALGVVMLAGRASHAYGLLVYEPITSMPKALKYRQIGMISTFSTLVLSGVFLLCLAAM